jgi:hypothetical protein
MNLVDMVGKGQLCVLQQSLEIAESACSWQWQQLVCELVLILCRWMSSRGLQLYLNQKENTIELIESKWDAHRLGHQ